MSGGIWTSQNKVRPGAYINFESESTGVTTTGERGIATLAMNLSWGDASKLIEVTMEELLNGKSLAKIGLISTDAAALLPRLALQNASVLKIYRLNGAGTKATLRVDDFTATAKYGGTFGNKIAILVTQTATTGVYDVQTYANGYLVDSQKVSTLDELVANDFVVFDGTGEISAFSSTLLSGGIDGTVEEAAGYASYFNILKLNKWNTLAVPTRTAATIASTIEFIRTMRDNEGKYVQAVVSNADAADYEGIINNINGIVLDDGTRVEPETFTAWVAGATAGALITESITGKIVDNTTEIINLKSNDEIVAGLGVGEFLLSYNQDGSVKVEKDINSLHTFTDKTYIFSKNRVIRELDEIGSSIENIWETTYLGKVSNDANGIALFKSSIIDYLTSLQNRGAITEFDAYSVIVERGNDIDTILASIAVKPLDSMEILYMTVSIN